LSESLEKKKKKLMKEIELIKQEMKGVDIIKKLMKKETCFQGELKMRKKKELTEDERLLDFFGRLKKETEK